MDINHTPGPWYISYVYKNNTKIAAPELLEALVQMHAVVASGLMPGANVISDAAAAIAKATGAQS